MVDVIILAAGGSSRMGRDKALLELDGVSFIRRIIGLYRGTGAGSVVVVVGPDAADLRREIGDEDVFVAENLNTQGGQISSLVVGLGVLEDSRPDAVLVHPVDHPVVAPGTVTALLDAVAANPGRIVVPVRGDRRGHPVVFPSSLFEDLKRAPADAGARAVIRARAELIHTVPTEDAGIFTNIDTPEEYERVQRDLFGPS